MFVQEKKSIRLDSDIAIAINREDVTIVTTFDIDRDEADHTSIPFEIGTNGEIVKFEMVSDGRLVEVELPIKAPKEYHWNEPAQALYIVFWRILNGNAGDADIEVADIACREWFGCGVADIDEEVLDALATYDSDRMPYRYSEITVYDENGNIVRSNLAN